MLEMKFKSYFLVIAAYLMTVECQREPSLPLSADSFRQILRATIIVPKGRKNVLSDTRMNFYRDSKMNYTSYRLREIDSIVADPYFDIKRPTVLYIHGYVELSSDYSVEVVVDAYIGRGGFNVLVLDWANCAFGDYLSVLLNIEPIGKEAGKALFKLLKAGLSLQGLHIAGHSMGAHVGAVISRFLAVQGYSVPRLTGLDPAYPGFYPSIFTPPISADDANFVDIIHTDGGGFGTPSSTGHADFWPNDGTAKQPGCLPKTVLFTVENFCSHWRSWRYWIESVNGGNFVARRCKNYDSFLRGQCEETAYMGLAATPLLRGNYYLRTAAQEPFALGERGAI